jgi:hypothetical protein
VYNLSNSGILCSCVLLDEDLDDDLDDDDLDDDDLDDVE